MSIPGNNLQDNEFMTPTTKVYITFGQIHAHSINGRTMDKDCVAAINCNDYADGRAKAFEWFDGKFHECYSQEEFSEREDEIMRFYPRGIIEAN